MALSPRSLLRPAAVALLAAGLAGTAQAAEREACQEDIVVDAADIDYRADSVAFTDVIISQCEIRVQAQRASASGGIDFSNTRWTFDGNVRITAENQGSLRSDQAVVSFANNRIERATITGSPAEFEQQANDRTARGRAREIVYDVDAGTVQLSNDAWLTDGRSELSGSTVVYNIRERQARATGEPEGGRARIILPAQPKGSASEEPDTPPP